MIITRDSVCMGDDAKDHKIEIDIDVKEEWDSLVDKLELSHFFPKELRWLLREAGSTKWIY